MGISIAEFAGALLGGTAVWMATRENPLYWVLSIFSVILYGFVLQSHKLYSDVLLHVFYLGFSFYGLAKWLKKDKDNKVLKVSRLDPKTLGLHVGIIILGTFIGGYLFHKHTDAALPYVDNFCTAASLVGTYWQSHKKIENWILWVVVNSVYIIVFLTKGLYVTAALYSLYLFLAFEGLRKWRQSYQACSEN